MLTASGMYKIAWQVMNFDLNDWAFGTLNRENTEIFDSFSLKWCETSVFLWYFIMQEQWTAVKTARE